MHDNENNPGNSKMYGDVPSIDHDNAGRGGYDIEGLHVVRSYTRENVEQGSSQTSVPSYNPDVSNGHT